MDKKTIYICGNPLLDFDSLPLKLIDGLQTAFPQIEFKTIDPNENLKPIGKKMIIIDTVDGIDEITVISGIGQLVTGKIYSPHDLDLGFNLQLMKKLGLLEEVLIFGVPMEIEKQAALGQLILAIKKYLLIL